jgi:hypothetical protein
MQPWKHAKATARRNRRRWENDLPIHEFMDLTKASCPDLRHRLVLHNADLGPELAAAAFPERPDARDIALAHVFQDLGCLPSLADWLDCCDPDLLPRPRRNRPGNETLIEAARNACRLAEDTGVRQVLNLLMRPQALAPGHGAAAIAVLCNSAGPLIVRRVIGPPRPVECREGGEVILDPSWIAEGFIFSIMGYIPSLQDALAGVRGQPE